MKIELLTPVHIGSGNEIDLYEWKVNRAGNQWARIDWLNLPLSLFPSDQILRNANQLEAWRRNNLTWEVAFEHRLYAAKVMEGIQLPQNPRDRFRECIKDLATLEPIIPGSSLKGAILTAYLYAHYEKARGFETDRYGNRRLKRNVQNELRSFARGSNPVNDFSCRFKVSDIAFPQSALRINLAERKIKRRNPPVVKTWVECISAGFKATATISFASERVPSRNVSPSMQPLRKTDVEEIIKRCNQFAVAVIQAELEYYDYIGRKYGERLPEYYEEYNLDFANQLSANECLVRVGWGSGKNAVSLVLMNSKRDLARQPARNYPDTRPKSRWLFGGEEPPGWCIITFEPGDWIQ